MVITTSPSSASVFSEPAQAPELDPHRPGLVPGLCFRERADRHSAGVGPASTLDQPQITRWLVSHARANLGMFTGWNFGQASLP